LMRGWDGGSLRSARKIRREKFAHRPPILLSYLHLPTSPPKVVPPFSPF
jgi:hypothetical protein